MENEEQVVEKTEEEVTPDVQPTPEPEPQPEHEHEHEPEPEPSTKPESHKEEEKAKKEGETRPQIDVQARIDRMYARLQTEREKRVTAEVSADLARTREKETIEEVGEKESREKAFSRGDIEAIWDRKEKEKRFRQSETRVLMRHSDALNEDGSFNMNSEFTRRYIDIGKRNPMLAMMESGPELAEAQVEKELGSSYKKGRTDEAHRAAKGKGAYTGASTTAAVAAGKVVKLSPVEAKIATRMGMTATEYGVYRDKISKGDKRVNVR